jgi:hypothetical protein
LAPGAQGFAGELDFDQEMAAMGRQQQQQQQRGQQKMRPGQRIREGPEANKKRQVGGWQGWEGAAGGAAAAGHADTRTLVVP